MPDDNNGRLSELYHCLRTERRREVIKLLVETTESKVSVRTLARFIAAEEEQIPEEHATGEPYRNAYNALAQTHLPTLAAAGIIIYDPQRKTVAPGPNLDLAALLIDINAPTVELFTTANSGEAMKNSETTRNDS